ncbi:PREDICTED: lectizyme-like [Rhagoletis zephyria]|uniref:lectizyme-like n=1 Tax=Rhagoletis zephyria TaxID=28612 RepID=UPI0008116825|nr:PREDICTED: lectizyme-like [Rhagoletis zephyria]
MTNFLLAFLLVGSACAARKTLRPESRIIGGEETTALQLTPYLVSLSVSSIAYGHVCAGAIIGREWVLTAAHCLRELNNLNGDAIGLPIYAGIQDRSDIENAQIRNIDFYFNHKQFNASDVSSPDIALLHVSQPFEFNSNVYSIILPYQGEAYTNKTSHTYGWGLTNADAQEYVKKLQVSQSEVLSDNGCREELPVDTPLGTNQICAKTSACFGDGGSPLVYETTGGAELVGITSWGYLPCGYNGRPTIYTEVSRYISWITEVQWAYYILH